MDRIRDLTGEDGRENELLSSTSGGLLDTEYLSDPPAAALDADEQPQYILRNKKAGLETAEGSDLRPDDSYQTLAIVTDCRVLVLAGRDSGDANESIPLVDIVEVSDESSGLLTNTLVVETADDVYRFSCRGDVSEVAAFVEDAAQTWATASRLIEDGDEHIAASRRHLENDEFTAARDALADIPELSRTARDRIATLGPGATRRLGERIEFLLDRRDQLEREIAAAKGAHHHAAAQRAWKADHDFERAAQEYDRGRGEYSRALTADGTVPTDESLSQRLKGLAGEWEILRVAPMADARAAREVAIATDDSGESAAEWETALTCYREAVTLDWGERDRDFVVDRERARKRADEATDRALDAHVEAGREWLTAGERIARNDRPQAAEQAYERAREHFETAREIARELSPDRVAGIEKRLSALARQEDSPEPPDTTKSMPSVDSVESDAEVETADDTTDEQADGEPTETEELKEALRRLDGAELTALVADVWEASGWSTTVFAATANAVYDVVALREGESETERLLLWTVHRPDGDALGPTDVQRCATARDSSQGAERATLVTTGTLTNAARYQAERHDVVAVDCEELARKVRDASLVERVL